MNKDFIISEIVGEFKNSFTSYAVKVISDRALPDIRDGLKPVQRRILYSMYKMNITFFSQFKKSARVVGDVIGKYHPHGDSSVYQAMVRIAQDFSLRYPLIVGQGNFGSIDGDPPAAMRYTEVKMSKISAELVRNLADYNVDFVLNYDETEKEPLYLTGYIPNLIINGSSGIAVGIATSIPPHNLNEIINGLILLIQNKETTIGELTEIIPAPDFPCGSNVYKNKKSDSIYSKGNGSVIIRAKYNISEEKDFTKITFTSVPYKVNKGELLISIAGLINAKKIEGIQELRDDSSRGKVRIVILINKEFNHKIIINYLFRYTNLKINFNCNLLVLVNKKPQVLNLKEILLKFIYYRLKILISQTKHDIEKTEKENHILKGILIAFKNIDLVVKLIKSSTTKQEAIPKLIDNFKLTKKQAEIVFEMKLSRLTSMEFNNIKEKIIKNKKNLKFWNKILVSKKTQNQILIEDFNNIKEKHGDARKCDFFVETGEFNLTNQKIAFSKDYLLVLTKKNYIKKLDYSYFKQQHTGGKGVYGIKKQLVKLIINSNNLDKVYFFTEKGKVFSLFNYKINPSSMVAQGIPINNLINIAQGDNVCCILSIREISKLDGWLVFLTEKGLVKKTSIREFFSINSLGKISIKIRPQDKLKSVIYAEHEGYLLVSSSLGRISIFSIQQLKPITRATQGVIGIKCKDGSATFLSSANKSLDGTLLLLTDDGYCKKIILNKQKTNSRANLGRKFLSTRKNNYLKFIYVLNNEETILISTNAGKFIQLNINDISYRQNKLSQGIKAVRLNENDFIQSAVVF